MADVSVPIDLQAFDREELAVAGTAVTLTAEKYLPTTGAQAKAALLSVQAQTARLTLDGTTPTSTLGVSLAAGSTVLVGLGNLPNVKLIREGGSDSEVEVIYFR